MSNDPDVKDGPLSRAEFAEYQNHPMAGETLEELNKDLAWHKNVLNNTSESDPVYKRFQATATDIQRVLHLRTRHLAYGVSSVKQKLALIVAATKEGYIGYEGTIPWKLSGDLKKFKEITTGDATVARNVIIYGRNTFESVGSKPLPNRINIVVTSRADTFRAECNVVKDLYFVSDLDEAIKLASTFEGTAFFIGGAKIYEEAMKIVDEAYITLVYDEQDAEYDTKIENFIFDPTVWSLDDSYTQVECFTDPITQFPAFSHAFFRYLRK